MGKNSTPQGHTIIWDLPLRLFHWSLLACVAVAAISGYFLEEWFLNIHAIAGYIIAGLLIFRLIWGIVGSTYSQFRQFPLALSGVIAHTKDLLSFKSKSHAGHNPIGAWMIVFLLITLSLITLSGLILYGAQEHKGPFASFLTYSWADGAEEIHEILAGFLMVLIAIHVTGVLVETKLFKHPVIKAMITGRKQADQASLSQVRAHHTFIGLTLFAAIFGLLFYGMSLSNPQHKLITLDQTYAQECGDCHSAYHPSLRTKEDWEAILSGLRDHYGENAELDDQTLRHIQTYLSTNDASQSDSEIAHKIGRETTQSHRMSDTPYWQKKHHDLTKSDFAHPKVGSKVNCNACHQDASTGRFDDDQIKLPKGIHS